MVEHSPKFLAREKATTTTTPMIYEDRNKKCRTLQPHRISPPPQLHRLESITALGNNHHLLGGSSEGQKRINHLSSPLCQQIDNAQRPGLPAWQPPVHPQNTNLCAGHTTCERNVTHVSQWKVRRQRKSMRLSAKDFAPVDIRYVYSMRVKEKTQYFEVRLILA